jgi:signal transduction histidine kinase
VIQEGLTNALVHSGADRASVTIAFADREIAIDVTDEGCGTAAAFGTGLTGMRERVQLLDGTLHAGPGDPGWRLHVRLPLEARA